MSGAQFTQTAVNHRLLYTGIFLISLSGLMLEVAITRIFSAAIWYHYAFVAVAVALLGLGSSGLVVQYGLKRIRGNWAENLAIVSALTMVLFIPFSLYVMHSLASNTSYLLIFMLLFTIPFFLIGLIISAAFNAFAAVAGRLYAVDLIGASAGALLVVALLILVGGEGAALSVGLIAGITATIFSRMSRKPGKTLISLALTGFALVLLVLNHSSQFLAIPTDPTAFKDLPIYLKEHPGSKVVKTQWNTFSRIDVVEGGEGDEGLVAKIFIDGGAGTNVIRWDGDVNSRQELTAWMQYLPYKVINNPKTLVIGSGGGRDIVSALVSGSRDVTSVEINPLIFETVKNYGERAGNVYEHSYVRAHVDEGRSFITRSDEQYDIIYIPFVDTWASVSSGGLGVSENFLYTIEGFQQYYDHLSDRGKIVTVRWLIDTPRFVSTYVKLLGENGIPQDQVDKHLIIVTADSYDLDPSVTMVVFSKSPFTEEEIEYFSTSFAKYDYKPILIPGLVSREPYTQLLGGEIGLEEFYSRFQSKAYYVTDDSPYFLSHEKPVPAIIQELLKASIVIVVLFLLIPFLWLWRKTKTHEFGKPGLSLFSIVPYFASLGIGFILLELALMQKLTLLLGNPITTFAILLFTLLISSGAGSLISSRILKDKTRRLAFVIAGIVTLGTIYSLSLQPIIYAVMDQSFELKVLVSLSILAPIGFLMGMPLPTGIRLLKGHKAEYIPWMWAINGAFSVMGAVLAVTIGIVYGSSIAMIIGILGYIAALGVSFVWRRKSIINFQSH